MGYVKYREDDIKITNHRMHMRHGSPLRDTKKDIRYFDCKYCNQFFTTKEALVQHIQKVHNIVRPLIVINDKVIGDHTVLQYIDNAKIIMYGFSGEIVIGNTILPHLNDTDIDITKILKSELSNQPQCDIFVNNTCISVELHPIHIEENPKIKTVIERWQKSVSNGVYPDAAPLEQFHGGYRLFMEGVYNYYLACIAERHKSKRYDDAYAALSQFQDIGGLGKCMLKAISFRRNWISKLHMLDDGEADVFTTACEFFDRKPSSFEYETAGSNHMLFVEESTNLILELIVLFQKGKLDDLKQRLAMLGDIDDLDDLNMIEQLYLLKARIAVAEGDRKHALRYYERLITPAFVEEYRRYQ